MIIVEYHLVIYCWQRNYRNMKQYYEILEKSNYSVYNAIRIYSLHGIMTSFESTILILLIQMH